MVLWEGKKFKQVEVQKKKKKTGTESIRRVVVSGRIHQKGEIGRREAGAHVTRGLDFSQAAKCRVGFDAFALFPRSHTADTLSFVSSVG